MLADNLEINEAIAPQFAQLVLDCIEREYPNNNLYWADSDQMPIMYTFQALNFLK